MTYGGYLHSEKVIVGPVVPLENTPPFNLEIPVKPPSKNHGISIDDPSAAEPLVLEHLHQFGDAGHTRRALQVRDD